MGKYDDMLALSRPVSRVHEAMARADRAKQFMPFAALKGYDDAIAEKQVIYVPMPELGEEQRDRLDAQLQRLRQALENRERPRITVCCFLPCSGRKEDDRPMGRIRRFTGVAEKMDLETGRLRLDGEWIGLRDIIAVEALLRYNRSVT